MLEIVLAEKRGHRRSGNGSELPFKKRMISLFLTATVVGIMLITVMQKRSLFAHKARRILPPTICHLRSWAFGCKLMMAVQTVRIFAVTVK